MLLEYMGRRGIDADIAKAYCKEAYYHFSGRKDRRCFAVAFPNDKGGMELRNPIFKGCAGVKAVTCLDNGATVVPFSRDSWIFSAISSMPGNIPDCRQ